MGKRGRRREYEAMRARVIAKCRMLRPYFGPVWDPTLAGLPTGRPGWMDVRGETREALWARVDANIKAFNERMLASPSPTVCAWYRDRDLADQAGSPSPVRF